MFSQRRVGDEMRATDFIQDFYRSRTRPGRREKDGLGEVALRVDRRSECALAQEGLP